MVRHLIILVKKTTEKVHKSKKDYSRKGKYKKRWDSYLDDE